MKVITCPRWCHPGVTCKSQSGHAALIERSHVIVMTETEKGIFCAHSFGGSGPQLTGPIAWGPVMVHIMRGCADEQTHWETREGQRDWTYNLL